MSGIGWGGGGGFGMMAPVTTSVGGGTPPPDPAGDGGGGGGGGGTGASTGVSRWSGGGGGTVFVLVALSWNCRDGGGTAVVAVPGPPEVAAGGVSSEEGDWEAGVLLAGPGDALSSPTPGPVPFDVGGEEPVPPDSLTAPVKVVLLLPVLGSPYVPGMFEPAPELGWEGAGCAAAAALAAACCSRSARCCASAASARLAADCAATDSALPRPESGPPAVGWPPTLGSIGGPAATPNWP